MGDAIGRVTPEQGMFAFFHAIRVPRHDTIAQSAFQANFVCRFSSRPRRWCSYPSSVHAAQRHESAVGCSGSLR